MQLAYNEGLVIVRCYGCDNLHLIADRLNWFEEGNVDVHNLIAKYGTAEEAAGPTSLQLSPEDINVIARELAEKQDVMAKLAAEAKPEPEK